MNSLSQSPKKQAKLLFISALRATKFPIKNSSSSSSILPKAVSQPQTHRQKLIKNRQYHLMKIRNEISQLVQNQCKNGNRCYVSSDFTRFPVDKQQNDSNMNPNANNILSYRKIRNKRRSIFRQKSFEGMSSQVKQQLNNLNGNLVAVSKRISLKQKERQQKQVTKQDKKVSSQKSSLPMLVQAAKTRVKFNKFQGKLEPWRYKNEDMGNFDM